MLGALFVHFPVRGLINNNLLITKIGLTPIYHMLLSSKYAAQN